MFPASRFGWCRFPLATSIVLLWVMASPGATVIVDNTGAVKFASAGPPQPEFRGFWADVFHEGFKSTAEIDEMIALAVEGNYNAIFPEVLAYHDTEYASHGAYWESDVVARSSVVTGGFDPLAYMVEHAHTAGLEVHPWLVAFRACTTWPPPGNAYLADHPEWIMVPRADMGGGPATVDGKYTLDPGGTEVQEYLVSIVKELVTDYEIDGIHWDYIRYTSTDAGYPADASYPKSTLARFQEITGRTDVPSTSDAQWNDFRRRTIDELVRRCRAEIAAVTSNPRQPLRHTAALISWGNAPSDFTASSAYGIFQNWQFWMQRGYLDAGCPMLYYREYNPPHDEWYRNWVNACIDWRYDRHMYTGPGIYLNSMPDSVTQLQYALDQGANGIMTYSYRGTNNTGDTWSDWYAYVASNLFLEPAAVPTMPWRDPATATEGTLWGQVTDGDTGYPIDDATVQVGSRDPVQTDGNGYYVVTLIPAGGSGTDYDVAASKWAYTPAVHTGVTVAPGNVRREDIALSLAQDPPIIAEVTPDPDQAIEDQEYTRQLELTQGIADSWTLLQRPPGAVVSSSGLVSGWVPTTDDVGQLLDFTVRASNAFGSDDESWQVLVEAAPPCTDFELTGFEGYANGTEVVFNNPRYSGSTRDHLNETPDVNEVTSEVTPYSGTGCYKLQWEFVDPGDERWLRATSSNAGNIPNPTIWLHRPIRVRLRLESPAATSLRVSLGIRETGTTAELGEDGGTTGTIEWVGAASAVGFAPQGKLLPANPGVWQTLIFDPASNPILAFTGDGLLSTPTNKGTLEHLAFACTGDVGPFTVYIDDIEQLCELPPLAPADFDHDGDVDPDDFGSFQTCALGPAIAHGPGCEEEDLDGDGDVDQSDFGLFQRCLSGINVPADPECAN